MAAFFSSKNVQPGEVVVVDCTNKPTLIHMWLALDAIGAAAAFVNYNLTGDPLLHCLRVSKAKLLIVDEDLTDKVLPLQQEIVDMGFEIVIFDNRQLEEINSLPLKRPDYDARRKQLTDISCIFYTRYQSVKWRGISLLSCCSP